MLPGFLRIGERFYQIALFSCIHVSILVLVDHSSACCVLVPLGMIPHKTKRGAEAMNRLKVFDGVPHPYDKVSYIMADASVSA